MCNSSLVPSGQSGGNPRGQRSSVDPRSSRDKQRAIMRENESADTLADKGYNVEQNPPTLPNGKNPDYRIEGKIFDNLALTSSNPDQIRKGISRKVKSEQTDRIILNLNDSYVTLELLRDTLSRKPINELKEIIVIKNGQVIPFFP